MVINIELISSLKIYATIRVSYYSLSSAILLIYRLARKSRVLHSNSMLIYVMQLRKKIHFSFGGVDGTLFRPLIVTDLFIDQTNSDVSRSKWKLKVYLYGLYRLTDRE